MDDNHASDMIAGSMPLVTIYSDGGSRNAPVNCGGYGAIMTCGPFTQFFYGGHHDTSNNYEELMGVLVALRQLNCPCRVLIVSDSQYVCNGINKGWVCNWVQNGWVNSQGKPVQNKELWAELYGFMQYHLITASWVKGHNGNVSNQTCDQFATIGMFHTAGMAVPPHLISPERA